ncbi:pentapeptide repeat-containing protein, partial [Neisseria sp. HMSC063B05]|uniref:pentapeptide repeat-containing protein n=1 Tax=Neisseria sp. HMSC063B05 TaxID=1739328 RepID=UPI00143B7CB9
MENIDRETLSAILKEHQLWIDSNGENGERADLSNKNLIRADLRGAGLRRADLRGADLRGA